MNIDKRKDRPHTNAKPVTLSHLLAPQELDAIIDALIDMKNDVAFMVTVIQTHDKRIIVMARTDTFDQAYALLGRADKYLLDGYEAMESETKEEE